MFTFCRCVCSMTFLRRLRLCPLLIALFGTSVAFLCVTFCWIYASVEQRRRLDREYGAAKSLPAVRCAGNPAVYGYRFIIFFLLYIYASNRASDQCTKCAVMLRVENVDTVIIVRVRERLNRRR